MAAMVAAEAGLNVVVIEPGEYLTPSDMTQREEEMLPRLFWDGGNRMTTDGAVKIHQGLGVGGSTLHNLNLCKRIPAELRARWRVERRLDHLDDATWDALYAEVERLIAVTEIPAALRNRHNQLLEAACAKLGWRGGPLSHNRTGCVGSGFCEVGCAFDAKNNGAKVLIPRAVRAGAQVLTRCEVVEIRHERGRVLGVTARVVGAPDRLITVDAPRVCLSASATGTAALLQASGVPDPSHTTGEGLRIHPALLAAGEFDEPVHAWRGIPQSYECTQFLDFGEHADARVWILPAFAHPVATSTMLPGHGDAHRHWMDRYAHLAVFTAMIHDHTAGSVRPHRERRVAIDYWPDADDRRQLTLGLHACTELLFAAGARRVLVPLAELIVVERGQPFEFLRTLEIERGGADVIAVHPMGSVAMDDDPARAAVGSDGKHHHVHGLWIADGSLFPSSIGVPPQLSIYAMGMHVARGIAAA